MIAALLLEPDVRGVIALNREVQDRWDDDGGAIPSNLAVQTMGSEWSMTPSSAFIGAHDRTIVLKQLEEADRHFAESEHRIARQQNLISKLCANRQITLLAVEFLRTLQASQVMHRAGCSRLQQALASLDEKLEII